MCQCVAHISDGSLLKTGFFPQALVDEVSTAQKFLADEILNEITLRKKLVKILPRHITTRWFTKMPYENINADLPKIIPAFLHCNISCRPSQWHFKHVKVTKFGWYHLCRHLSLLRWMYFVNKQTKYFKIYWNM